jgi:hypothetical protein
MGRGPFFGNQAEVLPAAPFSFSHSFLFSFLFSFVNFAKRITKDSN